MILLHAASGINAFLPHGGVFTILSMIILIFFVVVIAGFVVGLILKNRILIIGSIVFGVIGSIIFGVGFVIFIVLLGQALKTM